MRDYFLTFLLVFFVLAPVAESAYAQPVIN
jgi:hypothetical protein